MSSDTDPERPGAGSPGRPRLRVGVISAGRVGAPLGAALARSGHVVEAAAGVSAASVRRAEELLPDVPVLPPDQVAESADLVLLAVPDDALEGLVRGLVSTGSLRRGQIVVHTSGAHGVAALGPAAEIGALTVALHPVMTFTGRDEDLQRLTSCCIGVTAAVDDEAAWNVGEVLAVEMGAEPVRVPEECRTLYHAALAHGANHLATLVGECAAMLRDAGVEPAERLLAPLLSSALDNALRHGDRALTGPVARGDVGTVRRHLEVLAQRESGAVPAYVAMARRTADRAEFSGLLRSGDASEVRAVLDEGAPHAGPDHRGSPAQRDNPSGEETS